MCSLKSDQGRAPGLFYIAPRRVWEGRSSGARSLWFDKEGNSNRNRNISIAPSRQLISFSNLNKGTQDICGAGNPNDSTPQIGQPGKLDQGPLAQILARLGIALGPLRR